MKKRKDYRLYILNILPILTMPILLVLNISIMHLFLSMRARVIILLASREMHEEHQTGFKSINRHWIWRNRCLVSFRRERDSDSIIIFSSPIMELIYSFFSLLLEEKKLRIQLFAFKNKLISSYAIEWFYCRLGSVTCT